jgi:hypothetical protein
MELNDECVRLWIKEQYFKATSKHLPRGAEEKRNILSEERL